MPTVPTTPLPTGPVLEIGDSLGIDLGWGLQAQLAQGPYHFVGAAVGDTGLAEPWYYDWPAHVATELDLYHPAVLVVFLGANDVESLYVGGRFDAFGSPEWAAAYGGRVAKVMAEATAAGARVLWVGMPPMADAAFSSDMAKLNSVFRSQAAAEPAAAYLAAANVLGGPQGTYEQTAAGLSGPGPELRDPDGVHITAAGADVLAKAVIADLKRRGWLPGA